MRLTRGEVIALYPHGLDESQAHAFDYVADFVHEMVQNTKFLCEDGI